MRLFSVFVLVSILLMSCNDDDNNNVSSTIPIVQQDETYDITVVKDIEYAQGLSHSSINSDTTTTLSLKLDAYIPDNELTNRPVIMLIHGGGFVGGTKDAESMVNLANHFASRGWVAFSIRYRLLDEKGTVPQAWVDYVENFLNEETGKNVYSLYPASRDAKAALRWIFANAASYNINTDFVTVGGGSAGAITAVMVGITEDEDYRDEISLDDDPTLATTNMNQSTEVHTILDFWGSGLTVEALDMIYGINRFDASNPPLLIIHGTEDPTVEFIEAEKLRDTYTQTGADFLFAPLEGKGHGPWNASYNNQSLPDLSFDFVVEQQGLQVE